MSKLTKKELEWVESVNKVLARCPSKRLGFFTIGDDTVHLYDAKKHKKACEDAQDDLALYLSRCDGVMDAGLEFPAHVEGVCG